MKKTLFYISGPITGTKDFEDRFNNAESFVKKNYLRLFPNGIKIINPIKIGKKTENRIKKRKPTWQEYMKDCVRKLPDCNYIYMLKGYQNSKGAIIEKKLAEDLGLIVIYE